MRGTALVTGATDGLGRAVAERLAADGWDVHIHGRDDAKLEATAEALGAASRNGRVHTHRADLASLDEVRVLADEINQLDRLDLLINNAGIGSGRPDAPTRQESRDGIELRFAVNYLASALLTLRLLPLLRRSAPARVVMVSSLGQAPVDFGDAMLEAEYEGTRAYSQSKLAQISFANELAERIDPSEVTFMSLHPSTFMPTKIVLEEVGHSVDSLEEGVAATVRLATDPELEGVSGRFFDRQEEAAPHPQAEDPESRRRLWQMTLDLTGEPDPLPR
jgi:NAD(P)-dependent dehydrogenase (short-subunit alcohol dehydrogenase family)